MLIRRLTLTCRTRVTNDRVVWHFEPAVHIRIERDPRRMPTVRTRVPLVHFERDSQLPVSDCPRALPFNPEKFQRTNPPLAGSLQSDTEFKIVGLGQDAP